MNTASSPIQPGDLNKPCGKLCGPSYSPAHNGTRAERHAVRGSVHLQSCAGCPSCQGARWATLLDLGLQDSGCKDCETCSRVWPRQGIKYSPAPAENSPQPCPTRKTNHRVWPCGAHPTAVCGQGTTSVLLSNCSQTAATPWTQSLGSGVSQTETLIANPTYAKKLSAHPSSIPSWAECWRTVSSEVNGEVWKKNCLLKCRDTNARSDESGKHDTTKGS